MASFAIKILGGGTERKFEAIGLKLWVDYACWLFCDVFPRWREAVLLRKSVRRMQRVVADMTVRGATRQWLAGVEAAAGAVKAEAGRVAKVPEKAAAMAKATEQIKPDVKLIRICNGHGQIMDVTEPEAWAMSQGLLRN